MKQVLNCTVECALKKILNWGKGLFFHIRPYNKDIYDHIRCSPALLWQPAWSWGLRLIADITASWKQQRSLCTQTSAHFKRLKFDEYLVVSSHVLTPKHEAKPRYITWKQLFVCFMKQPKEGYISVFSFVFQRTWEDTTKHLASFMSF